MNSPKVVKIYEVFEDKDKIYIILELIKGGTSYERIKSEEGYTDEEAVLFMRSLLLGLQYIHTKVSL